MFIPAAGAAIFGALQVRLTKGAVRIDNAFFRLHHTFTATIFVIAGVLAAYSMTFQPMECDGHHSHLRRPFLNGYCSAVARYIPYSSPQEKIHLNNNEGKSVTEKVAYYKWVPYVLLLQGLIFLTPHWLWKIFEDEKMQQLTDGLNPGTEIDRQEREHRLVSYLVNTRHFNKVYAIVFYACEELNFVIALANIMYLDSFVGRTFSKYGLTAVDLVNTNQANRTDPMVDVFPHVIRCIYVSFGQKLDAVCVLPFNDTFEKLFLYLWCWLVFVITMATVSLLHRVVVLTCPVVRTMLLSGKASALHRQQVQKLVDTGKLGDFLVLYMLKRNVDPITYQDILHGLTARLEAAEAQTETNMCM